MQCSSDPAPDRAEGVDGRAPGALACSHQSQARELGDQRLRFRARIEASLKGCEGRTDVVLQFDHGLAEGWKVTFRHGGQDPQQDQPAEPFGDPFGQGR